MKHEKEVRKLKIAKGQLEGIIKMMENDEYCIDIADQLLSSIALLKNAQAGILINHLSSCLTNNINEKKIEEVSTILKKVI